MRTSDKRVFLEAAAYFQSWILVRRTNPASLHFIGQPGFTPKRIDCKAKTADVDVAPYQLAGLVVDPRTHPAAFRAGKQPKALTAWQETEPLLGRGVYSVDMDSKSRHYGCLRENGNYVHGDYDLYDVIDINAPSRNLAAVETMQGTPHMRGPRFGEIQKYINDRIGSPMVQHGGEAQYTDHSEQSIDAFGPNGENVTILNEFSLRAWYKERFAGRQTIGTH